MFLEKHIVDMYWVEWYVGINTIIWISLFGSTVDCYGLVWRKKALALFDFLLGFWLSFKRSQWGFWFRRPGPVHRLLLFLTDSWIKSMWSVGGRDPDDPFLSLLEFWLSSKGSQWGLWRREDGGLGPVEHSEIPQIATVSTSLTQIATVSAILTYVWMPSLCLASASWLSSSSFVHPCHHIIINTNSTMMAASSHTIIIIWSFTDHSRPFSHHSFGGKDGFLASPVFRFCLQFQRLLL